MSEEVVDPNIGEVKQTNRMFNQSEFDSMVAKKEKEISEKFKDYETLKQKADAFEKAQIESEQAKLSEVEKANKRTSELEQKLANLETEKKKLEKQTMKLSVLSDPRFGILPEPYKKAIDGEDENTIKEQAELLLKDFEEALKRFGAKQLNVGLPPEINKNDITVPKKPKDVITEAFEKRFGGKK